MENTLRPVRHRSFIWLTGIVGIDRETKLGRAIKEAPDILTIGSCLGICLWSAGT